MGTFTNDSGVIIASYNGEVIRFEKDGLKITSYYGNINIVSIQQNQRIERAYPAAEITSPTNNGADDLKAKLFLMLEDYGAGGGGVTDLQGAYDGGNVVNGATVIIEGGTPRNFFVGVSSGLGNTGQNVNGFGQGAGLNNTGLGVNAFGNSSAISNSGSDVNALGSSSATQNEGDNVNAIGFGSLFQNEGDNVNAIGAEAGRKNTANNSNFFGRNAGYDSGLETGNTTAFGVTVFSPASIPSYADPATAEAALTVANGCVAGQIYLYRQAGVSNVIGFVIPV